MNGNRSIRIWVFAHDYKQRMWQQASKGTLTFQRLKRGHAFARLLLPDRPHLPDAILFRYINDRPGVMRTFIRALQETALIHLAKLRRVRILWIAHNVDEESAVFHPTINRHRRNTVARAASRVFVTERHLVPYAELLIPHLRKTTLGICSFGPVYDLSKEDYGRRKKIASTSQLPKSPYSIHIVSANNWLPKKLDEIDVLLRLSYAAAKRHQKLGFIVAGPQVTSIRESDPTLYATLNSRHNVILIEGWIPLSELVRQRQCDFVLKSYRDLSLPLGFLDACSLRIPVISAQSTFLADLISEYGVGVVVDMTDIESGLDKIERLHEQGVPAACFETVFKYNNWESGAKALIAACS